MKSSILQPQRKDLLWRVLFLSSVAMAPVLYSMVTAKPILIEVTGSLPTLIIGGFLVGFGACVGSGCTSGHGICGLGRLSRRSLVVTVTFMVTSIVTVYVIRHMAGSTS